jgi:hypothetical protein
MNSGKQSGHLEALEKSWIALSASPPRNGGKGFAERNCA